MNRVLGGCAAVMLFSACVSVSSHRAAPEIVETCSATDHALVGSWVVTVAFEGTPSQVIPNLVTFNHDGTMTVAAPPILPEVPGSKITRLFSGGHGAWNGRAEDTAEVTFVFLVGDEQGRIVSRNTVRGALEVTSDGNAYTGRFVTEIAPEREGVQAARLQGTWSARRIEAAGSNRGD